MISKLFFTGVFCGLMTLTASAMASDNHLPNWVEHYKNYIPFAIQVKHEVVDRIDNKWVISGIIDGENVPFKFTYAGEGVESMEIDGCLIKKYSVAMKPKKDFLYKDGKKLTGDMLALAEKEYNYYSQAHMYDQKYVDEAYKNLSRFAYNVYKEVDKRNCYEITNASGTAEFYNVVLKESVPDVPYTSNISFLPMLSKDIDGIAIRDETTYKYGSNNSFVSVFMFKKINGVWNVRHPKLDKYVLASDYDKIDKHLKEWLLGGVLDKIYDKVIR